MTSRSKSSQSKPLLQFDRGPIQILNHFSTLNQVEVISLQLLFFALLEVLSLKITDNDPIKSRDLSQLLLFFLQRSKMLPTSMSLSAKSVRQLAPFQNYVRTLQESIQTALNVIQRPSSSSDGSTITSILEKDYAKVLFTTPTSPNIRIDIPQPDIQLKIPLPLAMNGTIATNDFDNIVIFRYVQDFYELDKLGKGAFGSVFRARNRLDDRIYAVKKIVFNENTDRIRRQAARALREVRVLASLSHPNIVQYHCAWLESVPIEVSTRQILSPPMKNKIIRQVSQNDSLDELIHFEGQSASNNRNDPLKSPEEDDSEFFVFESNGQPIDHRSHSDGDHRSLSSSKNHFHHSTVSNRELIPIQNSNSTYQSNIIHSKIVLFIQMHLCDTTLYDWLRHRDRIIIEETSIEKEKSFYSLNDLGQQQCWHIFKQLLTAIEYLHSQSFVHRDIKPRNIFLAYDAKDRSSVHVKLGDFGLATLLDSDLTPDPSEQFKNDDSTGVGTALYAPPEQLNSNHCVATDKSDSYSLGIVLFELFNIFPTEMERNRCLSDLRIHMKVDQQFSDFYPFETNLIEPLVAIQREKRLSVEQLLKIYSKDIQQRMKKQQNNAKQLIIDQLQEKLRDRDKRIQQLELELDKNKL